MHQRAAYINKIADIESWTKFSVRILTSNKLVQPLAALVHQWGFATWYRSVKGGQTEETGAHGDPSLTNSLTLWLTPHPMPPDTLLFHDATCTVPMTSPSIPSCAPPSPNFIISLPFRFPLHLLDLAAHRVRTFPGRFSGHSPMAFSSTPYVFINPSLLVLRDLVNLRFTSFFFFLLFCLLESENELIK